jgi:hypothetical protein
MADAYKAKRCDDGAWVVHDGNDAVAFIDSHGAEAKAKKVAAALNASTTFVPENKHGVKPGFYTRPDIVRLLRLHRMYPDRIQFIADMME